MTVFSDLTPCCENILPNLNYIAEMKYSNRAVKHAHQGYANKTVSHYNVQKNSKTSDLQ